MICSFKPFCLNSDICGRSLQNHPIRALERGRRVRRLGRQGVSLTPDGGDVEPGAAVAAAAVDVDELRARQVGKSCR